MGLYLTAAAAGLLFLPFLSSLPPVWLAPLCCLMFGIGGFFLRWRGLQALAVLCLTLSWSVWVADKAIQARLPHTLEGKTLQAFGWIRDVPVATEKGQRFRFQTSQVKKQQEEIVAAGQWHLFTAESVELWPDSFCTLEVKLKRPHGVANPGGFDTEAWLLSEGISATGSAKSIICEKPTATTVDGLRLSLRQIFQKNFPDNTVSGVVLSLITGDRSLILPDAWERYVATGVVHLMAISGLHITMIALVTALLTRFLLGLLWPRLAFYWPLHKPALLAGFVLAWLYSLMAGYSVPTERTLIMLAVVLFTGFVDRRLPAIQVLLLAVIAVLLWSPLAIHSTGFWLSFGAVAILMMLGRSVGDAGWWRQLVTVQFVLTLLLLPLTLWFFERASWVSPLTNLLAVPWVTFLVVPLGLCGLLLWLLGGLSFAIPLWKLATFLMAVLDALLEQFQSWPYASLDWSLPFASALLWLSLAVVLLVQPLQHRLRLLAPVFALALCWPVLAPAAGILRVTVLDVGQGLSVLLQTRHYRLLYDTGPPLGSQADAGQRYILPSLRRLGVYHLDRLVLSHDDDDHTGGAASILESMPVNDVRGPVPVGMQQPGGLAWKDCLAGEHWEADGWQFSFLYPDEQERQQAKGDNDCSCVLRVSRGNRAILLPGDLEKRGEYALLQRAEAEELAADVLVLGHHGSKGSSSPLWVAAVSPQWAIASAGYQSPFRHPSRQLTRRLEATGIAWINTASSGAITMELSEEEVLAPQAWRKQAARYWRDREVARE